MSISSLKFDGLLNSSRRAVPADWIDYNGHMNVSYYSLAFDQAIDEVFENILGIGATHTKNTQQGPYVLQNNLHYLGELLEGDQFFVQLRLLDHDKKRLHLFLEMQDSNGKLAATSEQLLMNVNLTTRRSTDYPAWVTKRLAEVLSNHSGLPVPSQLAAPIGIRRKG